MLHPYAEAILTSILAPGTFFPVSHMEIVDDVFKPSSIAAFSWVRFASRRHLSKLFNSLPPIH